VADAEFETRGAGPFAEAWLKRGIPFLSDPSHQPSSLLSPSPVEWLSGHGVLGPDTLCIHAVQLTGQDIGILAEHRVAIAHCPLSNARHRHGNAPLGALIEAGLRVGVGTDSVASVGALDLLAEARAAGALGWLRAEQTLGLATLEGARALGLETQIGSLTPGKWGDVAVIALPNEGSGHDLDPIERALASRPEDTRLTVVSGRVVYRRDGPT